MATAELMNSDFGFHVEFVDEKNRVLRDRRLKSVDFGHAIRDTHFDALRRWLVSDYQPLAAKARIMPVFPSGDASSPAAEGFRVTITTTDGGEHTCQFDISYFGSSALQLRAELMRSEAMTSDGELYYRLNAFLDEEEPAPPASKLAISLEPASHQCLIGTGCRSDFGPTEAWDEPCTTDVPMLVDHGVLEEIVDEARADQEREIAGFLLGHLRRDATTEEVFVAVTGLASAGGTTKASDSSVTYTPASFAQVRNIVKIRNAGETICGWYHSHPFKLCADCPTPVQPPCVSKVLAFSLDDIHLMESTFDQPYMVGLLTAVDQRIEESVGHLPVKLYGWRNGQIKQRGFEVFGMSAGGDAEVL